MLLYIVWLFLPVVQRLTGLRAGLATLALFGIGLLLDQDYLRVKGPELFLRVCAAVLLPLYAFCAMYRGDEFLPFLCQNGMFWFPAIYCAYARFKGGKWLSRYVAWALLATLTVTALTTTGWDLYCRFQHIDSYSRYVSMGWVSEEKANFIMLRNIGNYDFVYSLLLALPLVCALAHQERGALRWAWMGAAALVIVTLVAADYALALLAALVVLLVMLLGALLRILTRKSRHPLSVGQSFLCTVPVLVLIAVFRNQLIDAGAWLFTLLGLRNVADAFVEMKLVFGGQSSQIANADSRLIFFGYAWNSFAASPWIGSMGRSAATNASQTLAQHYAALGVSGHSDVLDVLSGMGLYGAVMMPLLIYTACHGAMKGVRKSPSFPYVALMLCVLFAICCGTTVLYSRENMVIVCVGTLLLTQREETRSLPQAE